MIKMGSCLVPLAVVLICCTHEAICQSSNTLDEARARLALTEAQQGTLQNDVRAKNAELMSEVGNLADYAHSLETLLTQYHAGRQVGFHARLTNSTAVASMDHVVLDLVTTNQGGAYNSTTGEFTAPYNGTYFLLAGGSPDRDTAFWWMMVVDVDTVVCLTISRYGRDGRIRRNTCQAVLHLTEGQRVWLRSGGNPANFYTYTYFSGFLVNSDF